MEIRVPFSIYLDVLLWKKSRTWYLLCLNVNTFFLNKSVKCKLNARYIYQTFFDKSTQKKIAKTSLHLFLHQFYSFEENSTFFHLELKIQFVESVRAFAITDFGILNFTSPFQRCLFFICSYKTYVKLMDVNSFKCLIADKKSF